MAQPIKQIKTKLRVGDTVQRIAGSGAAGFKRRGTGDIQPRGKIVSINFTTGKAIVQGLNIVVRHTKRTDRNNPDSGGRIEKEAPIHLSNLMLVDPSKNEITRIGAKRVEYTVNDRKKIKRVRVTKLSATEIPGGKK